jgi:hypothetical protein
MIFALMNFVLLLKNFAVPVSDFHRRFFIICIKAVYPTMSVNITAAN